MMPPVDLSAAPTLIPLDVTSFASECMTAHAAVAAEEANQKNSWGSTTSATAPITGPFAFRSILLTASVV
jgi:hypothetical protein